MFVDLYTFPDPGINLIDVFASSCSVFKIVLMRIWGFFESKKSQIPTFKPFFLEWGSQSHSKTLENTARGREKGHDRMAKSALNQIQNGPVLPRLIRKKNFLKFPAK